MQVDLFKNEYPLGKTVRIDGQPYQIIGLLEKKVKFLVHHSIILQLSHTAPVLRTMEGKEA